MTRLSSPSPGPIALGEPVGLDAALADGLAPPLADGLAAGVAVAACVAVAAGVVVAATVAAGVLVGAGVPVAAGVLHAAASSETLANKPHIRSCRIRPPLVATTGLIRLAPREPAPRAPERGVYVA